MADGQRAAHQVELQLRDAGQALQGLAQQRLLGGAVHLLDQVGGLSLGARPGLAFDGGLHTDLAQRIEHGCGVAQAVLHRQPAVHHVEVESVDRVELAQALADQRFLCRAVHVRDQELRGVAARRRHQRERWCGLAAGAAIGVPIGARGWCHLRRVAQVCPHADRVQLLQDRLGGRQGVHDRQPVRSQVEFQRVDPVQWLQPRSDRRFFVAAVHVRDREDVRRRHAHAAAAGRRTSGAACVAVSDRPFRFQRCGHADLGQGVKQGPGIGQAVLDHEFASRQVERECLDLGKLG
mmetsp:Transcript_5272/g.19770  ORF Transcript_5272/g.19770 Transcript_5272/m.19770 type:complete len:293 (+) Transcript_5272:1634-2512(+)